MDFSIFKRWTARTTKQRTIVFALLGIIILLAAYLRIDFLQSVNHKTSHDTKYYDIMVRQLLEDNIYAYKDTVPNANVTPGYPLVMAAIYKMADYKHNNPFPYIRYLQVVESLIMIGLLYLLARRLAGDPAGLIVAAVSAVYPPFVWTVGAILTETQAALFFVLYVYLQMLVFEKRTWPWALAAGAALGLTVLTRPEFLILIAVSYAFFWAWHKKFLTAFKLGVWTALGLFIVLSPWIVRNVVTLHEVVVASTQVNPFTAGTYPDKNYEDGLVDRHNKTQMEVAKERLRVGFETKTWTFVKWYTYGKIPYIYGAMFFGSGHSPIYHVIPYGAVLHLGMVWAAIPAGLFLLWRWRNPASYLALLLLILTVTRIAFVPEFRYNFTSMPLIIVMDTLLGLALVGWVISRTKLRRYIPAAGGAAVQ